MENNALDSTQDKLRLHVYINAPRIPLMFKDEQANAIRSMSPEKKQELTHPITLGVSGVSDSQALRKIVSLVNAKLFFEGSSIEKIPDEKWSKKPYANSSSGDSKSMSIPIHLATVDDLRLLLKTAKECGVEFESGHERSAIDEATRIIEALGVTK